MKLSAAQNAALRAIDAGDISPVSRRTLIALWNQGLIEFALSSGWRLTRHGRLAMDTGRLMLSNRSPE